MASKLFVVDSFRKLIMDGSLDLDGDTIYCALVTEFQGSGYTQWAASTAYNVGDIRIPTTRNGHRYRCTVAGTSDVSEPTWPTTDGGTVVDGTVTWEEYGGDMADLDEWGDVSANEVAAGDGYTAGGELLANCAVTYAGDEGKWDADDVTWTALTKTMLFAFLYASKVAGTLTNPLIAYVLLDTSMTSVSVSGVDFTITWDSEGILKLN
jgi:hypothetical protein